ncbi:MAG TPA: LPS assembly lipoprotein LptE [Saprospiraceae bacterium]|nr:LPS assembly lipoprotein LptE [Saprospiraceae bacterium]HMQ82724.1 LPS assembly lipoprotein LptE [Saprospiraceae bacterium]
MRFIWAVFVLIWAGGCYSFKGFSIDYSKYSNYYVSTFQNTTTNSPPTLPQTLTENLKEKIRVESKLVFSELEPHVEFAATIVRYDVTSEAPSTGETASINRLNVNLAVEYINHVEEDKGWKKNFPFFFDFPVSTDLASIEDDAINEISKQLMEDIFNAAFNDW